jgi:hypothetical protein
MSDILHDQSCDKTKGQNTVQHLLYGIEKRQMSDPTWIREIIAWEMQVKKPCM